MSRQRQLSAGLLGIFVVLLQACATTSPYDEVSDPLEGMNRAVYRFNDTFDRKLFRPVAKSYQAHVPSPVRTGVRNVFRNIYEPIVIVNDLLQWKPKQATSDTMRFGYNTVFGVLGLVDVATPWGMEKHHEDFGQTFGVWGFGEGPYLVLPFLGPSTMRDGAGLLPVLYMDPISYYASYRQQVVLYSLLAVSIRADLLAVTNILDAGSLDAYLQVRTAYRQKRWYDIYDGNPPEDGFSDDELFDD